MTTEHKLTFVFVILAVAALWQLGRGRLDMYPAGQTQLPHRGDRQDDEDESQLVFRGHSSFLHM